MADREFGQQRIEHRFAQLGLGLGDFEDGADVLLDRETAENRGFLRQIADAEPRPAIHRQIGDVAGRRVSTLPVSAAISPVMM